jgi:hypothetical protein
MKRFGAVGLVDEVVDDELVGVHGYGDFLVGFQGR